MKLKRILAVAMATTMVLGMSMTALAEETSGSSTGAGASEGHVEKKATRVILPTVATDGEETVSPYRYTMDPERLIAVTAAEKYTNVKYPQASDDKGVYFNNGAITGGSDDGKIQYTNTSNRQTVVNKSSHAINLTVTAEAVATEGGTDIPLVKQSDLASATDASLYLGLIVGEDDEAISAEIAADKAATTTVSLAGTPDNFKIAATSDKTAYEYRVLTLAEYQALDGNSSKTQDDFDETWKSTTFAIEGEATSGKAITSTTTAPKLKVTWSWVDPEASTPATIELLTGGDGTTYVAAAPSGGFTDTIEASKITSVKANNVDVTAKASVGRNMIIVSWPDIKTALDISSFGDIESGKLDMVYVYDGTTYKGTYTP